VFSCCFFTSPVAGAQEETSTLVEQSAGSWNAPAAGAVKPDPEGLIPDAEPVQGYSLTAEETASLIRIDIQKDVRTASALALRPLTFLGGAGSPIRLKSSTQFLWNDDITGRAETIFAQYLRISYAPQDSKISASGYGRFLHDFSNEGVIRDNDLQGRLYYLYLDYTLTEDISLRLGRHYVNFSAGSSLMDGATLEVKKLGFIGMGLSVGRNVQFSLDSEDTKYNNFFAGLDVHLVDIRWLRLDTSYIREYDDSELAREELGVNFRAYWQFVSPYSEVRYDWLSDTVDEAVFGIDVFPVSPLLIRGEYYFAYPTFDSTSIYSVFAVDKYREYLVRAEYSFEAPVTVFGSYISQEYEADHADVFLVGTRLRPTDKLTLNLSVDYRDGFGGNLVGGEIYGDYRLREKLSISAGGQYDAYRRPEGFTSDDYAQRYWIGCEWRIREDMAASARIEDNINENFNNRVLGRVAFTWTP